jgi:hypothetical protein
MKLTREYARQQAARLQACPMLVPQSDKGRAEIIDCLLRHCQSAEHSAAVMTQFLDGSLNVRNPVAELATIARATQTTDQPPAGCDGCYLGTDIDTGEVRWAAHVFVERNDISFARRCLCARGRYLRAADIGREKSNSISSPKPAQLSQIGAQ